MDVAVVGAGIIGCAVACELARRGARVTVFDPRPPGGGATQASAGVLAPFVEAHDPGPLQDLIVRSVALYDDFVSALERDSGVNVEYARCGSLEVAADEGHAARLQRLAAAGISKGARWIGASELEEVEPLLQHGFRGGLLVEEHGFVDASALVAALYAAGSRRGVEFTTAAVDAIRGGVERPQLSVRGRSFPFDRIVVAAGSWSGLIAGTALNTGVVRPVKGQLLHLTHGCNLRRILWSEECYLVPRRGEILVGATMEDVGFDEEITPSAVATLLSAAERLLPAIRGERVVQARAGLRPATTDGLPIIGPSRIHDGLVFATGHFRNGIALAPVTAAAVADCVYGAELGSAFGPFQPGRFDL